MSEDPSAPGMETARHWSALEGGAVMCAWVVGVWALAAWTFHRRDA